MRYTALVVAAAALLAGSSAPAQMRDVAHPFILWTREDAAAIRKRLDTDPLAKQQYQRMASTDIAKLNPTLWNLFNYLVMGDQKAAEREKAELLKFIGRVPEPLTEEFKRQYADPVWNRGMPSGADKHMRDEQTLNTLRYDVLYDLLSDEQRQGVEKSMRAYIQFHLDGHKPWHPDFRYTRIGWLPNMHWPRAIGTHLMAAALKDPKLIEAMHNSQGGWKWYFDKYISDGRFYNEEFGKYYSNIGTMLMYCEALERLGLGQYGYGYTGEGGATMRKFLEMKIWTGLPRTTPPTGMPRYGGVVMGDAGGNDIVSGYTPDGKGGNRWWSTSHMNGPVPKMQEPLWFEFGHRRWPDAHFDYFLAQMRMPGEKIYLPSLYCNLSPIDPRKVTPPPAPSYVARERGFALLRADESPAYWEGPRPAVALQFAMRYVHYVHDCFAVLNYVAFNRNIYERMGGVGKGYAGGDPWRDHVRGQASGVVVDGLQAQPIDGGDEGTPNHRVRHRFDPLAKFVAIRAKGIYPDVDQERALVLTEQYLLDVSSLVSSRPRVYDWHVMSAAKVIGGDADPWKPAADPATTKPHLAGIRVMNVDAGPWTATLHQEADPAAGVGVRVSMLPEAGTTVLFGTPPGFKEDAFAVKLLATRTAPTTVFAALHEPYTGGVNGHRVRSYKRIAQAEGALAVAITGDGIDDRILYRHGDGHDQPTTLTGDGESFTFADYAFVRVTASEVTVYGDIRAMKVKVAGNPKVTVNGKPQAARVTGNTLELGER